MSSSLTAERPSTAVVWLKAIRPATLFACVSPIVVGTAIAASQGAMKLWVAIVALVASALIQIGTNLYNDYADFEKGADNDQRLGPARAAQKGWLTPGQVKFGAFATFAASIALGSTLVVAGGWPILLVGLVSVAAGIAYTGGPYPLAYVGLGDLFVMLFFGFVAVCGTVYLQTGTVDGAALLGSVGVGALNTAILVVNNLRDRHTDANANKRTLAVRFGAGFVRAEYVAMVTAAYAVPVIAWAAGVGDASWMLCWVTLPLAVKETIALFRKDGVDLNPHLGGTARVGLLYALTLAGGIVL